MAFDQPRESINDILNRSEKHRNLTRNFLLDAFKTYIIGNEIPNGLNRYYQIRINSLINRSQEDVNHFVKLAENNTRCIKCGSYRNIKIRSRRSKNRSPSRKYCRYLRSLCDFICEACQHSKTFKLKGRKALKNTAKAVPTPKLINARQSAPIGPTRRPDQLGVISRRNPAKKTKTTIIHQQAISTVTKPKQPPSFSSRLRAFSCLLKE